MALNNETLAWIAALAGESVEDISAKISSEDEVGIKKPQGEFFTSDQISLRDSQKYKEGKEAGQEMLIKDWKNQFGYEIEGKDPKAFIEHHNNVLKEKYSSGADERVTSLEADLKKQREAFESEISQLENNFSELSNRYRNEMVTNKLLSVMPKETTIKPEAIITLFNANHTIDEQDGNLVVKKNGEIIKDEKTASPLSVKDIFSTFVLEEGYAKKPEGRGGSSEHGEKSFFSTAKSPEEFQRMWQSKNPDKGTTTQQFYDDYATWRKAQRETA